VVERRKKATEEKKKDEQKVEETYIVNKSISTSSAELQET